MPRRRFDRAYFERFYSEDSASCVVTDAERRRLGRFVASYLAWLGQPVRTVLDLGCGLGAWKELVSRHFPRAVYTGVEVSPYLCREYGWRRGSVVDFRAESSFDLVICQGVLQYLDARDADRAIANLAKLTGGALFLEALTREDWERNCDPEGTDEEVYKRPAAWYRKRLRRHFVSVGGGIFLAASSPVVPFELDRAE